MKWIALLIFGGVGLFLFVTGFVVGYQSYVLSRDGVRTQGHVVEVERREGGDDDGRTSVFYYPVVEFSLRAKNSTASPASTDRGAWPTMKLAER